MGNDIFGQTFDEWTRGCDPLRARIAVFERVRDLPVLISFEP